MASVNGRATEVDFDREIFARLGQPFEQHEVKTRPAAGGRQLHYVTATTVANRLDDVCGPENWEFDLKPWGENALIGTLILTLPSGRVVRKSNVGGRAEMAAGDDDAKSAASDCLKRCATLVGIGRHLYQDGMPKFVREYVGQTAPAAEPVPEPVHRPDVRRPANVPTKSGRTVVDDVPRNGRQLWAWAAKEERDGAKDLLKGLVRFGRQHEFPERLIDWDSIQTGEAVAAMRNGHERRNGTASVNPDADDPEEGEGR